MWVILHNDDCHAAQSPHQSLYLPLSWYHDTMVKSFLEPQTEMNQTDAQRLMFSWKKTELENIFGDEITEPTTHTVSLHNMLLRTEPSETNMHTLLESQGDPHFTLLSPKQ